MTATAHAVIGVVIAAKIGNPALAIPIALASHIAADMIPHWDTGTHRREKSKKDLFMHSFYDGMLSLIVTFLLINFLFPTTSLIYAYIIVFFSQLPDILTVPYRIFDIKFPFIYVYRFQKLFDHKLDKPWGIVTQVIVVSLLLILAKLL